MGRIQIYADVDGLQGLGRAVPTADLREPLQDAEKYSGDPGLDKLQPGDPMPVIECPACGLRMLRDGLVRYLCRCGYHFAIVLAKGRAGGLMPEWAERADTMLEVGRRVAVTQDWSRWRRDLTQTHEMERG
jgi:hypothetical protein